MKNIEKRVYYVANKVTHGLPFGDKDVITKDFVYKKLNLTPSNAVLKIKEANLELLDALYRMVLSGEKLVRDKRYYTNERRDMYLKFKERVLKVIDNRKIFLNITDNEDELIQLIDNNCQTILFYREEAADILSYIKAPIKKTSIFSILDSITSFLENNNKKNDDFFKNEIIENTYLDPLEEEMVKKGEIDYNDFDEDEYYEDDDFND